MEITDQNQLVEDCYYWVIMGQDKIIAQWEHAIGWHFSICGSDDIVRFSQVKVLYPVCQEDHRAKPKEKSLPTDNDRLFDWCAVTTRR